MNCRDAVLLALVAASAMSGAVACGSSSPTPEQWSASYAERFERVWSATQRTLEELGYEIEASSRSDGTIEAVEIAARPYRGIALTIDLTEGAEEVRVDVRAAGGPSDGPDGFRRLDEAVRELLDALDRRLDRRR